MGLEVLFWIWVLTWMAKRSAEDVLHAVKGTPNPRYELKKQRAAAAGKPAPDRPRYGTKEWAADLYSDALAAHTEKRRTAAKAKAQPIDDLAEAVRESKPERVYDPNNARNCSVCKGEVVLDGRPCPRCLAEQRRRNAEWEAQGGLAQVFGRHETPEPPVSPQREEKPLLPEPKPDDHPVPPEVLATARAALHRLDPQEHRRLRTMEAVAAEVEKAHPDLDPTLIDPAVHQAAIDPRPRPTARVYQFPNPKHIEKEITMANSEATSLATAIAFAEQAATAHTSFATTGAEGYVGALEQGGNSGEVIGSAREAMEASGIAADKWAVHKAKLEAQQSVKEAYQGTPGAGDKQFLLNG